MKIIKIIAIFTILVVFPALSWYYLDTGLAYRKEARISMEPKESLDQFLEKNEFETKTDLEPICQGKTSLVLYRRSADHDETINKLFEQFQKANTFQIVILNESGLEPFDDFEKTNLHMVDAKINSNQSSIILIDQDLQIRNVYNFSEASILEMVSHTALLIPRTKPKDIKVNKSIDS